MSNPRVTRWFNDGHSIDAILGTSPFFLRDHTFLDAHARLLVIGELIDWAVENARQQEAGESLISAVRTALHRGDLETLYDILWCYLLLVDTGRELSSVAPADFTTFLDAADALNGARSTTLADAGVRSATRQRIFRLQEVHRRHRESHQLTQIFPGPVVPAVLP